MRLRRMIERRRRLRRILAPCGNEILGSSLMILRVTVAGLDPKSTLLYGESLIMVLIRARDISGVEVEEVVIREGEYRQ